MTCFALQGLFENFPQEFLAHIIDVYNQNKPSGCSQVTLDDLYVTGLFRNTPSVNINLDAAAIGIGQNVFPSVPSGEQQKLKQGILSQIEGFLQFSDFKKRNLACFLEKKFLTVADITKIEARLMDTDVDIYIDKDFLDETGSSVAYVDFDLFSLYFNDLILAKDPKNVPGQDLTHEMFHAIFDLHDDELSSVQVPDDEALTSYFDYVIDTGFLRLVQIEQELDKARAGKNCDQKIIDENLEAFESDLLRFRLTGGNGQFLPITTQALDLMRNLTGFNVPIFTDPTTDIVERYRSGECGVCVEK